jgi:hypothetical protein
MSDAKTQLMTQINNMLFGVRNAAPGEISKIGQTQAGIGLNTAQIGEDTLSKALAMLGLGANAQAESGRLSTSAMAPEAAASKSTIGTLTDAAGNAINAAYSKWG